MDIRDQIILQHAPLIACPKHGSSMPHMNEPAHRFIAAEDGLWLEVMRSWLHLRYPIATAEIPLPYGRMEAHIEYPFDAVQIEAFTRMFIQDARDALPNEAAACVIWNDTTCETEYRLLDPEQASPGAIRYHRPVLADHEALAIDLHSHGDLPAFWSPTDDEDDTGEVKLAIVVGEVNDNKPAVRIRLCALGLFIDLDSPL